MDVDMIGKQLEALQQQVQVLKDENAIQKL
jgi:hypothetical protein